MNLGVLAIMLSIDIHQDYDRSDIREGRIKFLEREYPLIKAKKSKLSASQRRLIVSEYESIKKEDNHES